MSVSDDWLSSISGSSYPDTGSVTQHAKLYDLLFADYALDVPMYLKELPQRQDVLECGIGTGRIALPLARSGRPVFGIDSSDSMLHELRSKLNTDTSERAQIEAVKADLRSFNLGRKFSTVICPFMTFNYFLALEDRLNFLRCASEHIAAGGSLWLELMTMNTLPEMTAKEVSPKKIGTRSVPETKLTYIVYRTVSFDLASQIVEQDRHYVAYDLEGRFQGTTLVTWRNRFVSLGELEPTLLLCGLEIDEVYGDHRMGPYQSSSQFLIVKVRQS